MEGDNNTDASAAADGKPKYLLTHAMVTDKQGGGK